MSLAFKASLAAAFSLLPISLAQSCGYCQSFGVDFITNGSYFQNSLSAEPFTAVQNFEGCTNDTSHNVLVDPHGKQYECSMTPMGTNDAPEQLSCPISKDQMISGKWSLLILSNNGDCAPIDYERDFFLSVGPQQTTTVGPTVYVSSTVTPIENSTIISSETLTSTAPPSTTTVPRVTLHPTVTIRPLPTITKVTKAIFTITRTRLSASIVATTTTISTAKCHIPHRRHAPDPKASILATVLSDINSILGSSVIAERDTIPEPTSTLLMTSNLRAPRLNKRAPDEPTTTITDPSLPPSISTITGTAPTQTIYITSTTYYTSTFTPVVTVRKGAEVSVATVTLPQRTLTKTIWTVAKTTKTRVQDVTLTITSVVTPTRAASRCERVGGTMS